MEQFDYSEWMKQRIETLLLGVTFNGTSLRITEVVKVEGSATILLIRGTLPHEQWPSEIDAHSLMISDSLTL